MVTDVSPFTAKNQRVHEAGGSAGVYCNGTRKNGEPCGHKVARVPIDEWEEALVSGVEIECRSCRKTGRLSDFV